jgi:site-specific recombinase XerD
MMTEHLFSEPVLKDLYFGPLEPFLNCFEGLLLDQGYRRTSIHEKIRVVADFRVWLHQQHVGINELSDRSIDEFIKHQERKDPIRRGHFATLRSLVQHLGHPDVTFDLQREDCIVHDIEKRFAQHLSQERGLAQTTVETYVSHIRHFLDDRFDAGAIQIHKLNPGDITAFLLRYVKTVKRITAKSMTTALRAFFRYLRLWGEIDANFAEFIPRIADWRLSELPKSLEGNEVERLLSSCNRSNKVGQRDYTILLVLARLGLRAGEVAEMTLDDIDWEAGEIIIQGKGPRKDRLPLPWDVGEALVTYLQHGRPACSTRRIFIRAKAPHRGFSSSVAVCNVVERALLRAKLQPPRKGAHLLRHSLATNMLRKGTSLSEIGEILRHASIATTEIYTKVDIAGLRTLAQPWPGGVV